MSHARQTKTTHKFLILVNWPMASGIVPVSSLLCKYLSAGVRKDQIPLRFGLQHVERLELSSGARDRARELVVEQHSATAMRPQRAVSSCDSQLLK